MYLLLELRVHLSKLQLLIASSLVEVDNAMRVLNGDIAYVADRSITVITEILNCTLLLEFVSTEHRTSKHVLVISWLELSQAHSAVAVTSRNDIVRTEAFIAHKSVTREAEGTEHQFLLAVAAGCLGITASFGDEKIKEAFDVKI